jgi:Holliday junction resolvase RusA-like endonuclease
MIRLTVTYCPSTNNLYPTSRSGHRYPSKQYKAWRVLNEPLVHDQMRGQTPVTGPFDLRIVIDRLSNRAADCSNRIKAIEDLLVHCGVVRDDSDARTVMIGWSDRKPGRGAMARVEIDET